MGSCKKETTFALPGHLRDVLIVAAIGVVISLMFNPTPTNWGRFIAWNALYGAVIGTALWKGNEFIGYLVWRKFRSHPDPIKELRSNLILMFAYSLLAIVVVNYLWILLTTGSSERFSLRGWIITMAIQLGITLIIGSIMYSKAFFRAWRESVMNEEKLKRQSLSLQYEALKNQVNPHFLFNSLNTLSSLVHKNPDLAEKFIKQLSEVYRYVLEHKDKEFVALTTELDFVEKYVYLQKIRHGSSLEVSIDVPVPNDELVIPMSLQILVENAIKHNIISEDEPLRVKLTKEVGCLVVRNNLNPKQVLPDSSGIGLSNLKDRYEYFSDKDFVIEKNEREFIVRVPLLKKLSNESIDHRR